MRLLLLLLVLIGGTRDSSRDFTSSITLTEKKKEEVPLDQRIRTKLKDCHITDSLTIEIFIAQARFESGNFTNRLTRDHNNIFSMRNPRKRPTKSLGPLARAEKRNGYASFRSIEEATEDFVLYLEFSGIPRKITLDQYCKILKQKGFYEATEKHYRRGVNYYLTTK